jgi:hypothetical protein
VRLPIDRRREVWQRCGTDLRPGGLDDLAADEVGLDGVLAALDRILAGDARGRTLVRVG